MNVKTGFEIYECFGFRAVNVSNVLPDDDTIVNSFKKRLDHFNKYTHGAQGTSPSLS